MIPNGKDRIECAIRHIRTSVDIDPWAMELAIEALKALSDCSEKPNNTENDDCISRKWCLAEYDRQHVGPPGEARKIIVEAPSIFPTQMSGTSDAVSRRMVLDALHEYMDDTDYTVGYLHDVICNLPSAQPEIIHCKDCKFTDGKRPIADGRYWCVLHPGFMDFCSDAEKRTDG